LHSLLHVGHYEIIDERPNDRQRRERHQPPQVLDICWRYLSATGHAAYVVEARYKLRCRARVRAHDIARGEPAWLSVAIRVRVNYLACAGGEAISARHA